MQVLKDAQKKSRDLCTYFGLQLHVNIYWGNNQCELPLQIHFQFYCPLEHLPEPK